MSRFIVAALALALCSANASAIIATPHVAGSHQGWDPGSNPMTDLGGGIYSRDYSGLTAGSRHEYTITDGTWTNSVPGPNSWFIADPLGAITLYYDTNTYADGWSTTSERLAQSYDTGTWTAAGDFQSEIGGGDWDNANPNTAMTSVGGGVYQLDAYPGPGTWQWKAVRTGSWDSISFDNRSTNTANWSLRALWKAGRASPRATKAANRGSPANCSTQQ